MVINRWRKFIIVKSNEIASYVVLILRSVPGKALDYFLLSSAVCTRGKIYD